MQRGMVAYGTTWLVVGLMTALAAFMVPVDPEEAVDHLMGIMCLNLLGAILLVFVVSDSVRQAVIQAVLGVCLLFVGMGLCRFLGLPAPCLLPVVIGLIGGLANSCSLRGLNLLTLFGQGTAMVVTALVLPFHFPLPWGQALLALGIAVVSCVGLSLLVRLFPSVWSQGEPD